MAKKPNKNRQAKNNEEDTHTNLSNNGVIKINNSSPNSYNSNEILIKESSSLNNNCQSNVNLNTKDNMNNSNLKEKNSSKENLCKEEIVEGFSFLTFLSYNDLEKSIREKEIIDKEQSNCKSDKAQNDNHQNNNLLSVFNSSNSNVVNKKKLISKDCKESQSSNISKSNCSVLSNSKNNFNSNNTVFSSSNLNTNTSTSINSNSSSSLSNKFVLKNCKDSSSRNNSTSNKIKSSNVNEKGENEILRKKKLSKESNNNVKDLSGNISNKDYKNSDVLNKEKNKSFRSKSSSPASNKLKNKEEKSIKNEDLYKASSSNLSSNNNLINDKSNKSKNKEKGQKKQDDFKKEKSKKDNDHRIKKLFKDDQDNYQSKKKDKKEKTSEDGDSDNVYCKELSEKKKVSKDKSKSNLKSSLSMPSIKESFSSTNKLNKSNSSSSLAGINFNSDKFNKKNSITSNNLSTPSKKKKQRNNLQTEENNNFKDEKELAKKVSESSSGKITDNVKKLKTNSEDEADFSDSEKTVALNVDNLSSLCKESLNQSNNKEVFISCKNKSNDLNDQPEEIDNAKNSIKNLENDKLEILSQNQTIKNENNLNLLKDNVDTKENLVADIKQKNDCNVSSDVICLESVKISSANDYQSCNKKPLTGIPDSLSINSLSTSLPVPAVLNNPFLQPPTNLSQVPMFDPIFSSNSRNLLRQELNNRFLASSQERPNMLSTTPFLRPEFLMPPFMFNKFDFARPPTTIGLTNSFSTSLSPILRTSTPTTVVSSSLPTRSNSVTPNIVSNNPSSNLSLNLNSSEGLSTTRPSSTNSTFQPQMHSSTHNLNFPYFNPQSHAAFQPKSDLNLSNSLATCSFNNNLNKNVNNFKKGIKTSSTNMQTDVSKTKSFNLKLSKWCSMHLSIAKEIDNQQYQNNDKTASTTKDLCKQGTIKSSKNISSRSDILCSSNSLAVPKSSSLKSINSETLSSSNLVSSNDNSTSNLNSSISAIHQSTLPKNNVNLKNSLPPNPNFNQFHPPNSNDPLFQNAFSLANMSSLNNSDLMKGMTNLLNLNSNNNFQSNITSLQNANMTMSQLTNSTTSFSPMNSSISVQPTFTETLSNRFNSFPNQLLATNNKELQIPFGANNSSSQLAANSAMFLRPGLPAFGLPHTSPSNAVTNSISIHHQSPVLPSNNGLPISAANTSGLTPSITSGTLNPLFTNEMWSRARIYSPLLNSVGVPPPTTTPNSNWPLIKTDPKYLTGNSSSLRIHKDNQLKTSKNNVNSLGSGTSESLIMKNFENGFSKNNKLPTPTNSPSKNNISNNLSAAALNNLNQNNFSVHSNMYGLNSNQQSFLQRPSSRHHNTSLPQQTLRSNRRDVEKQNYKRDHSLSPINHGLFANQANNFHNSLYHANKLQKLNESPLSKTGTHAINSYQNGLNHFGHNSLSVPPHLMSLQNTLPNAQSSTSSRLPSVSINANMNPSASSINSISASSSKLSEDHRIKALKLNCLPSNSVIPPGFSLPVSNELNLLHPESMALERARMLSVFSSLSPQSNPSTVLSSNTNNNYSVLAGLPQTSQSTNLNNPLLQQSIHGVPTSLPYQNASTLPPGQNLPLHSRLASNNPMSATLSALNHSAALANLTNNSGLSRPLQFNPNEFQATADAMKYLNTTTMFSGIHPVSALPGPTTNSLATPQSNQINPNLSTLNQAQSLMHSVPPDLSNPFKNLSDFTRVGYGGRDQLFSRYNILDSSGGGVPLTEKLSKDNSEKRVFVSS